MNKIPKFVGLPNVSGIVKNGTSGFSGAIAGADYQAPITLTTTGTNGTASFSGGVVKGDQSQIDEYINKCLAVKAKYPKPTS